MKNKRYSKIFAIMVLTIFMGVAMATGVTAEEEPYLSVEAEEGTSDEFGGGDYVFIKFNKDAAFGVLYGTDDNPNSIVLVAMHVRYLGGAEVYDDNGAKMGHTVPIPVLTVFAMKLEDIFEFNDTNGDDVCNYRRWGFGLKYSDYYMHEPIYKSVNLETSWERSDITKEIDRENKEKSWSFSLTATDLPYRAIGDSDSIRDDVANEVLDKVEFTFHLTAKVVHYDNISVPMYKVTVKKGQNGQYNVVDSERIENREFSGDHGNYVVKYDHLIEGWDFDPTNADPHLLLEWHAIVGNMIPFKVEEWLRTEFIRDIDEDNDVRVDTDAGEERYNEDNALQENKPFLESPRRVKTRHIQAGADWAKVGRLTWVSNVNVDGEDGRMYAQVQGAKKISTQTRHGNYYGFALLAGFSYPGGDKIFHDPGLSNDMPINIEFGKEQNYRGLLFIIGLTAVVGLIAVTGVAYTLKKKGKAKKDYKGYYNGAYDVSYKETQRSDWDRYYRRE
jgi:hypothetical protein